MRFYFLYFSHKFHIIFVVVFFFLFTKNWVLNKCKSIMNHIQLATYKSADESHAYLFIYIFFLNLKRKISLKNAKQKKIHTKNLIEMHECTKLANQWQQTVKKKINDRLIVKCITFKRIVTEWFEWCSFKYETITRSTVGWNEANKIHARGPKTRTHT